MILWIVVIILFILQLIGFYLLALLYTKVSKFDDLERKQRKLMEEMDDAIVAYLSEMKDENERLVELLVRHTEQAAVLEQEKREAEPVSIDPDPGRPLPIKPPKMPINLAIKSYNTSTEKPKNEKTEMEAHEWDQLDTRSQIFHLHDAGMSEEEIAKKLGKGRTEVELILKFR